MTTNSEMNLNVLAFVQWIVEHIFEGESGSWSRTHAANTIDSIKGKDWQTILAEADTDLLEEFVDYWAFSDVERIRDLSTARVSLLSEIEAEYRAPLRAIIDAKREQSAVVNAEYTNDLRTFLIARVSECGKQGEPESTT